MRTCRRMGIQTVGVYSEADMQALHIEMADESYFIGSSPARQSYLDAQKIIDVAKASGAKAIHPGYGFLSENADFAAAVEAADLVFIGPCASVIRLMGDKLQAKSMARQAHVSIIPGSEASITTKEDVQLLASQLGYPLLLKAAAGGGGKGMRVIYDEGQIDEALYLTSSEAISSFGDGRIFVEKYVEAPRHIEIQVLGDTHGNILHLGERDCSLQRRHQKVIEETPSPFMTPELRQAMTAQAIALARHVGYTSAGTIEFMVTPDRSFYFLEVNTRLQVEHPITEMVTGIDIVEHMIRIAAGEPLSLTQSDVSFSGHAVEARLYAEDTTHDFLPCSGRVTRFDPIVTEEGLRIDTGIEAGTDISIFYDPLLAKLISWAPNRLQALQNLQKALAQMIIEGPFNNAGFLEQLLLSPKVIEGDFTTLFIENEMTVSLSHNQKCLVKAIAALIHHRANGVDPCGEWVVVEEGNGCIITFSNDGIHVEGEVLDLDLHWRMRERRFVATLHGQSYYGQVRLMDIGLALTLFGIDHSFQVMSPKVWNLYAHVKFPTSLPDNLTVKAPMPGILVSLSVSVGDRVKLGQMLLVIEAMKMENALTSPVEGIVTDILAQPGDSLVRNQTLVKLG